MFSYSYQFQFTSFFLEGMSVSEHFFHNAVKIYIFTTIKSAKETSSLMRWIKLSLKCFHKQRWICSRRSILFRIRALMWPFIALFPGSRYIFES